MELIVILVMLVNIIQVKYVFSFLFKQTVDIVFWKNFRHVQLEVWPFKGYSSAKY